MTSKNHTSLTDAALAELDRWLDIANQPYHAKRKAAKTHAQYMVTQLVPALRQRLTDAESRLADAERERDAAESLVARLREALETLNHAAKVAISTEYWGCFDEETPLVIRLLDGTCDETDAAIALTPAQSLARCKAEALNSIADKIDADRSYTDDTEDGSARACDVKDAIVGGIRAEADRMEKEGANGR